MAVNYTIALTNAEELDRIILFTGLDFDIVVTPQLLGEPVLTAQGYYFLSDLDAVAKVRFENHKDFNRIIGDRNFEEVVEALLESYCFVYSQKHPCSALTPKVYRGKFWSDDVDSIYHRYDNMNSECLVLDKLNEDTIVKCEAVDDDSEFYDWCLIKNYSETALDQYVKALTEAKNLQIQVELKGHHGIESFEGVLPIMKHKRVFTYYEASAFEIVSDEYFDKSKKNYKISRGFGDGFDFPQEVIEAKEFHNRELLAYYLTAIRECSPLAKFRNLYNVIEYFYGEVGDLPAKKRWTEKEMLIAAMNWVFTDSDLKELFWALPLSAVNYFLQNQRTSSEVKIYALPLHEHSFVNAYCERLYSVRNACTHSKKKRNGAVTARFVPSYEEEELLTHENIMLQAVTAKFIERETLNEKVNLRLELLELFNNMYRVVTAN